MSFTRDEFQVCLRDFYEHSQQLHDRWQWVDNSSHGAYLTYAFIDEHCHRFDYHLIYSDSYAVPVLYFNASRLDGSLLSLNEVWQLFPYRTETNMYETITQQEHPILHRPFYLLHPCHTERLLGQVHDQSAKQRFLLWLSIYGQAVGLPLSLDYATNKSVASP
jgi:hypothetical protein